MSTNVVSRFLFDILIILELTVDPMRDFIQSSSQQHLISPTAFIADLQYPQDLPELHISNYADNSSQGIFARFGKKSVDEQTKGSEKVEKKRLAGLKSREKKKKQLQELEESVKHLTSEIEQYDSEISKCKDKLVEAIKTSTNNSSEHSFTFAELARAATGEDPDLDRINLLLDLIQNRIGANGKERQSKLQYNFKQIINSLFPAAHRYFMHSAVYNKDLFEDGITPKKLLQDGDDNWTKSLYESLSLTQEQISKIAQKKDLFKNKRKETVNLIVKLKESKNQLKHQQEIFQRALTNIREDMNPVQSAQLILFGENNKLRQQFSIFCDEFAAESAPAKRIKTQ